MRAWPLVLLLAIILAAPAVAQEPDEDIWSDDPYAAQDETVLAVDRLLGALLDLPIGRLAQSMPNVEIEGDFHEDDTVRDFVTRDDPEFEEKMRGGARALTAVVGTMMQEFAAFLPQLEAMGEQLEQSLPE